ncbi:MAG: 16S rRNA (cytidine(1402)-2'-O)-methyltransferase [Candidatus Binataceae bacterium]|nr:16S rRNA (cytidine(1402)-2'-O)-methyltransferase [Candidatus Binataceae bacterium]
MQDRTTANNLTAKSNGERVSAGVLYVVATPIGNSGDVSARAIETLSAVDLVACEDTRRTGALLAAHRIRTPMLSYFEHNEDRRIPEIIERLRNSERVALVTDAGTPAISDPGFRLVRAAHHEAIEVRAVPGASAIIAALSIAGIPTDRFAFEGFLPARPGALRAALEALRAEPRTMVFYEAARRLGETLTAMGEFFGPDREAAVVREITKIYEESIRGTLGELAARYTTDTALGELTLVVAGASETVVVSRAGAITVEMLVEAGLSVRDASAIIARAEGSSRREVYQRALRARDEKTRT